MELTDRFEHVCREIGIGHAAASFHPYSELKHTWRRTGNRIAFKISDYLDGSPEVVLDSLAWYLICRAFGEECPIAMADRYLVYVRSKDLWQRAKSTFFARARNISLEPKGEFRDLKVVFDYVNFNYFRGEIRNTVLAWVKESPARRLGFYFEPLSLLAVNEAFDSDSVPRHVLEFVVYHELLHCLDALNGMQIRRVHHTKEFRQEERYFSSYHEAEGWLRKLACKGRTTKR